MTSPPKDADSKLSAIAGQWINLNAAGEDESNEDEGVTITSPVKANDK